MKTFDHRIEIEIKPGLTLEEAQTLVDPLIVMARKEINSWAEEVGLFPHELQVHIGVHSYENGETWFYYKAWGHDTMRAQAVHAVDLISGAKALGAS